VQAAVLSSFDLPSFAKRPVLSCPATASSSGPRALGKAPWTGRKDAAVHRHRGLRPTLKPGNLAGNSEARRKAVKSQKFCKSGAGEGIRTLDPNLGKILGRLR